jgi:hypothetical protein
MVVGVFLLGTGEKQESPLIGLIGFIIFALAFFGTIWSSSVPPLTSAERRERFALLFGITAGTNKVRQIVETLGWLGLLFGGLLLGVKALEQYPVANESVLLIFPILMIIFFLVFSRIDYCKSVGAARLTGWLLIWILFCKALMAGLVCGGLLLWFNGAFDQTQEIHRVSWIDKRVLVGKKRVFHVEVTSWRNPDRHLLLTVPAEIYHRPEPGKPLEIATGSGLFHIEWIRSISLSER